MMAVLWTDWFATPFPSEWVKGALVLGLVSSWVVIALFAYLNHRAPKPYLSLWTVAWMFYSVYLAASLSLPENAHLDLLAFVRQTCIGISALFLFWGSLYITNQRRSRRELGGAVCLVVLWNAVGVIVVRDRLWCTMPMFLLLAAAGVYSATPFLRAQRRTRGATLLGIGLLLWSLHVVAAPSLESLPSALTLVHLALAGLALLIPVGIVMEEERMVTEQPYRVLFESASAAIFLLDPATLQVFEANRAAQQLCGRKLPDLIGCHLRELCPDLYGPDLVTVLGATSNRNGEFRVLRADGSEVCCEGYAHVVPSSSGAMLQIVARDVSERRRWLQELNVKSAAIEAAASAIVIGDRDGAIIWANRAFTELTGYTLAEARGHHIWFLRSDGNRPALYKQLWDTVLRGESWSGQVVNRRKDGSVYTELLTLTPVRDAEGRVTNFIAIKQLALDVDELVVLRD
jgi:PAS domain S-box-containing protein